MVHAAFGGVDISEGAFDAVGNGPAWIRTRDQRIMSPLL